MGIKVRSGAGEKFTRRAGAATEDYRAGVNDPRADWAGQTAAAEGTYNDGVTQAIQRKAFGQGVRKAGTAKWQEKAAGKGADRFGPGVQAAGSDYEKGVAPYTAVLQSLNLPQRYAKGDPRNLQRVAAVTKALRDKKTGTKSVS